MNEADIRKKLADKIAKQLADDIDREIMAMLQRQHQPVILSERDWNRLIKAGLAPWNGNARCK